METTNHSKQKVIDAAKLLFFQKGFHGASVRNIADAASVNLSLISYYFKSKQGLLEYAVVEYYEAYLQKIEQMLKQHKSSSKLEQFKEIIFMIIQYKQENLYLSCIIHRELSLQSVFVKEVTVTYLAKENHLLRTLLFEVLKENYITDKEYLFMQLKGMLITPYILHHEWKYHVIGEHSHDVFVEKYVKTIYNWLDFIKKNE